MFDTVAIPMGYAELHCHTNFSFLDGASHPEELAEEAARLGLAGLAVTDHDGLYGAVRFALAAREHELPTVFGAELTLGITRPANGEPDPEGEHLLVLAEGPVGYARLARAISEAQMAGELDQACELAAGLVPAVSRVDSATLRADVRRLADVLSRRRGHRQAQALLPALRSTARRPVTGNRGG